MAANQISNQRGKSSDKKPAGQAARQRSEPQKSSSDYGSIGEMAEQASEYVTQSASEAKECVREHSVAAISVALIGGFGIGFAIGHALAASHRKPRSWRDRITAEGIGRRLMDRVEALMPDMLAEHFAK